MLKNCFDGEEPVFMQTNLLPLHYRRTNKVGQRRSEDPSWANSSIQIVTIPFNRAQHQQKPRVGRVRTLAAQV